MANFRIRGRRADGEAERLVGEWCDGPAMPMPESK